MEHRTAIMMEQGVKQVMEEDHMKREVILCVVPLRGLEPPPGNRYMSIESGAGYVRATGWVSRQLEYEARFPQIHICYSRTHW